MVRPSPCSRRMIACSFSVSSAVCDEVGSSMMMTRASRARALRISTFCWSAMRRACTGRSGGSPKPTRSSSSRYLAARSFRSQPMRLDSSPRKTFSPTVRSGTNESSCWIMATPAPRAVRVSQPETVRPAIRITPSSGRWTPPISLPRVDLPAPFSPTRAWIVPASMLMDTSSTAWVVPKRLLTCSSRIAGSVKPFSPMISLWLDYRSLLTAPLALEVRVRVQDRPGEDGWQAGRGVHVHDLLEALAIQGVAELLHGLRPHRVWIVGQRIVPETAADRLDGLLVGASATDEQLVLPDQRLEVVALVLEGDLCSFHVLICVGEQHVDLRVRLEDVGHRFERGVPVVVALSGRDDLDVRVILEVRLPRVIAKLVKWELKLADQSRDPTGVLVLAELDHLVGLRLGPDRRRVRDRARQPAHLWFQPGQIGADGEEGRAHLHARLYRLRNGRRDADRVVGHDHGAVKVLAGRKSLDLIELGVGVELAVEDLHIETAQLLRLVGGALIDGLIEAVLARGGEERDVVRLGSRGRTSATAAARGHGDQHPDTDSCQPPAPCLAETSRGWAIHLATSSLFSRLPGKAI